MSEMFHQFREPPFGVNPDPRFLYLSRTHREAFASLLYRIEMDSGFVAMVAQPGMGKTTLLFHLLEQLQPKARTAFIFQTQCTSGELLRHLLSEFECRTDTTDPVRVSQELKSMLLAEASAGRRCVLVVDEAQNLGPEVLETIRLLSNFETPRRKLLNIVLSGQSELGEMLARAELRQLRQRLSCIVRLEKFTAGETARYIAHRLAVVGYSGQLCELFSADAVGRIADFSEEVPRVINSLCFNALSLGYALGARQIDVDLIEEAALDLGLTGERDAKPDDPGMEEQEDADARLEWSEAFRGRVDSATTADEAADATAANDIEEQSENTYGPEEGNVPTAAVAENWVPNGSIAEASSRPRRRQREAVVARGLACLLVLLLTPAIDRPANYSVSAESIQIPSNADFSSGTDLASYRHERANSPAKHSRVSHRTYPKRGRRGPLERYRATQVPVDLRLASFAPEPLLQALPLQPMPLPERTREAGSAPRMRVPVPRNFGIAQRSGSGPNYVPPQPVWQPSPSVPAWYRHPKEDIQLLLSISSNGKVNDVGVLSGRGTLAYSAMRAAKMWKYQPALDNGKPVSSKVIVTVEFLEH
jgi:type II secretory pathway predicted ATPase ExeA